MYDCQTDTYTEFHYAERSTPRAPNEALCGELQARPLAPCHTPTLSRLAAHAAAKGYTSRHMGALLRIENVTLSDALAINAAFGHELVVSCELRQDPPARFLGR